MWGELPSAYWLRDSEKRNMMRDLSEAIRRDYNHPCLIAWAVLNESWGVPYIQTQKEAQKLADALYKQSLCAASGRLKSRGNAGRAAAADYNIVRTIQAIHGSPPFFWCRGFRYWPGPSLFL